MLASFRLKYKDTMIWSYQYETSRKRLCACIADSANLWANPHSLGSEELFHFSLWEEGREFFLLVLVLGIPPSALGTTLLGQHWLFFKSPSSGEKPSSSLKPPHQTHLSICVTTPTLCRFVFQKWIESCRAIFKSKPLVCTFFPTDSFPVCLEISMSNPGTDPSQHTGLQGFSREKLQYCKT